MTKVNPEATSLRRSKRKPRPTHKAQILKAFRDSRAPKKNKQTTQHDSPLKSKRDQSPTPKDQIFKTAQAPRHDSPLKSKRDQSPTPKDQIFKTAQAPRHDSPLRPIGNTWQLNKDDNDKLSNTIGIPQSTEKYQQKQPSKDNELKIAPSPATNLINNLRDQHDQYESNKQPQQLFK